MDLFAIIMSLLLLMLFAFRGYSIILFAPVFALLAASASNYALMPVYSELFMTKAAEYFKMYFPIFLLGAIFAKVMEEGGVAGSVAGIIVRLLGKEHAILAVVLGCGILTYGGISVFVVVFVMYPFAAVLYRQANIPKRFIPAALWLGSFTFSMGALPGTPQIQNIIPSTFYGTTTWAAPITGVISALLIVGSGLAWLIYRQRQAFSSEGYGQHLLHEQEPSVDDYFPHWALALLPLIAVVLINLYLSNPFRWPWAYSWDPQILAPFAPLKLSLLSTSVDRVRAVWSLNIALVVGILLALVVGRQRIAQRGGFFGPLNAGAAGSLTAVLNTASGYAYGSVVSSLAGFALIKTALLQVKLGPGPLVSEAITANIMAAITGSASGGITIALGMLSSDYLAWAQAANVSPEMLHRIVCLAAGGFDSLPHNGGLVTIMVVCGLTHKAAYYDIFIITLLKSAVPFLMIAFYALTGWL